ncbi:MAG: hypothetical protein ACI9TH_002564 [Kiritimatiellia bacterium]|jgi:glycosyltransferase 2 family protein
MKRKLITQLIRILLCACILWWISTRMDLASLREALSESASNGHLILVGVAFTFLGLVAGVLRWYRMLIAHGFKIGFGKVFQILFIGQFFNAFMPGACGGDVIRAFYVTRESEKGTRAETATTAIADRLVGLLMLMFFCSAIIGIRLRFFLGHPETKIPGLIMLAFMICALGGLFVFFKINLFERIPLFRRMEERLRIGPVIRRAYDTLYDFRNRPGMIAEACVYSLLNMIFLTLACMAFGASLGIDIKPIDYFTFFPIITVLSSIPITPGALGIRESLFERMFAVVYVASTPAVLLSLLVYFGGVACSLFGGLMFIFYTTSAGKSVKEEWEALRDPKGQTETNRA